MGLFLSTTGVKDPVVFNSLGGIEIPHPTIKWDLLSEFRRTAPEILGNPEIVRAIENGEIVILTEDDEPATADVYQRLGDRQGSVESYREINAGNHTGDLFLTKTDAKNQIIDPTGTMKVFLEDHNKCQGKVFKIMNIGSVNIKKISLREDYDATTNPNGTEVGIINKQKQADLIATSEAWTIKIY